MESSSQLFPSSSSSFTNSAGGEESRNWEQLPRDVMVTILMKLSPCEILESVQFVCRSWYQNCKDPETWTKVEILGKPGSKYDRTHFTYTAITRSRGLLLEITLEHVCDDWLLLHIAERSTHLRCLRIRCPTFISGDALFEAVKKLPLLEEAEFTLCGLFNCSMIRSIGQCCPNLVSFKLNERGSKNSVNEEEANQKALAIAETMPHIHHLQLIGSRMTNKGLQAILNNCHCLKSLDLRACFRVDLSGNLGKSCTDKVKNMKWPHDWTSDIRFGTIDYLYYNSDDDSYDDYNIFGGSDSDESSDTDFRMGLKIKWG